MTEKDTLDSSTEAAGEGTSSGPLGSLMPPDPGILNEARRLLGDRNSRVDNLATMCLQDPIILIELLKKSNALFFTGGGQPITTAKTAIVRLGSDVMQEILDSLAERTGITDPDVQRWFNAYRSRSRRIGIVTRIFSESVNRALSEDCQTIGSMYSIGDMLAVHHFGQTYVELADSQSRSAVNYKLAHERRFDIEKMGVSYLRRNGIPEALLFALDREARPRDKERSSMKPVCMASMELVDAFDNNKWERFAPGKKLAPKSAIRMLQLGDVKYLKIYERTSEFLFSARMLEERNKQENPAPTTVAEIEEEEEEFLDEFEERTPPSHDNELQSEIENILGGVEDPPAEDDWEESEVELATNTDVSEIDEDLGELDKQFNLSSSKTRAPRVSREDEQNEEEALEVPQLRTKGGNKFMGSVASLMQEADNSEDLLASLLQMLVDGPFEKAALIVISHDRRQAIVVAARGPIGNGQKIEITDPLSPLAQCFTKVQSFSSKPNEASPFGCKSFAVSPIDADHDTPVALYADCGDNGALSFEARRIFRTVVGILNETLPTLPGGIPVELDSFAEGSSPQKQ